VSAECSSPQAHAPCNAAALRLASATAATALPRNLSMKTVMPPQGFAASGVAAGGVRATEGGHPRDQAAWSPGEEDPFWEQGAVLELAAYGDECCTPRTGQ